MSLSFVSKLQICDVLDQATIATIKKIYVFGNSGDQVIYITKDDEIFALGANDNGCLGLGDTDKRIKPHKIEELCEKQTVNIAYGSGGHMLAVTASGTVFSWGNNTHGQLGIGHNNKSLNPVQVTTNLKEITQVVCGQQHSVALNSDGEIFAWGQGVSIHQSFPTKVITGKAISIACGANHSVALLDNGEVYGWGTNTNYQLGLGNATNQPNPCKVQTLHGFTITQIVCGSDHTLVLSDKGSIYSWGYNGCGQLGTGDKTQQPSPVKVKSEERFIEIAANHWSDISAALTETGKVYMWGLCCGNPVLTGFSTTDDIFVNLPTHTWRMYSVDENSDRTITGDIAKSFDDSTTSDITFKVEGKPIHCHKAILKLRSDHFRSMFQSHWDEDKKDSIEVPYPYHVYKAFLYFLYNDSVDLCPEGAIGLLELANSYCEKVLKCQCEQIIKQGITIENAAMLYAAAVKFEAKDLEDFCFKFAQDQMTHVTQTEAFGQLDESILRQFILKASQTGAFKT